MTGSGASRPFLKGYRLMSHKLRVATASLAVFSPPLLLAQATLEPLDGFERVELAGEGETLVCMTGGQGTPVLLLPRLAPDRG
jgi:hypothetical protein